MADDLGKINLLVNSVIEELTDKQNLEDAAKVAIERMKTRTRLGKGVREPEGNAVPLQKLQPKTVQVRKDLAKQGLLTGKGATPSKSAINRSGKTLDSLEAVSNKDGQVTIKLDSEGERVVKELEKISPDGFTFMNLSKAEVKAMADELKETALKKSQRQK